MFFLSANDAFTNPDSPWYYVVGTAFLVLIFVALGIYVAISKKKKKHDAEKTVSDEKITDTALPDAAEKAEKAETTEQPAEVADKTEEPEQPAEVAEKSEEPEQPTEVAEKAGEPEQPTEVVEKAEEPEQPAEVAEKDEEPEQPAVVAEKAEEPAETAEKVEKAEKPQKTARTASKSAGAKTASAGKASTTKKKAQKPFIDRLIAAESAHSVYNELKNTILSYPGIKAKLTKDDEQFWFGEDKKAKIELKGASVMLFLNVDPATVPAQFGVTSADGDCPTVVSVSESKIDNAQKLIMFAMNVSMLTRNEKHRHVNYIQNAINAKARSKSTAKG